MIDQTKLNQMAKACLIDWPAQYAGPPKDYWGQRTVLQLQYAVQMAECGQWTDQSLIRRAIDAVYTAYADEGAFTRQTCAAMEEMLQPLAARAKRCTLLCIGHAHIDMNWMWAYDDTVAIALDTFRTMLDLMREYPDFTYAQSQASVYEIVAKHDPAMLAEIRQRVHEGRWEVTAATWVEADRNMPNAESMARQLLYTRQYLSGLLEIPPESLDLDYEPDTFGHHRDVPEILQAAGVRYYYHCRGGEGPVLYKWRAPSGREVLAFREPLWYNWTMDGRCALAAPSFCARQGMDEMLRVYGVGDHGGGPTRRDIERIIDMNTWPVFPSYRFGTYHEFFQAAEKVADRLPVVSGELNFIFDGCYTTQSRIKQANRRSEAALFEAEAVSALAHVTLGRPYPGEACREAWKNVLFNQFHDILPGSGKIETREYAMALYQQTFALANTQRSDALRMIAGNVDTADLYVPEDIRLSRSEGAGAGYPTGSGELSQVSRHAGWRRIFLVWNSLPFDREETCTATIWDWPGDPDSMQFSDGQGRILEHQVLAAGINRYWEHLYQTVLVRVPVPAAGYATLVLDQRPQSGPNAADLSPRVEHSPEYILENEYLLVRLSSLNGSVISLVDKETGTEMVRSGVSLLAFRLIEEDTARGMTAWTIGRYKKITELADGIRITGRQDGPLRRSLTWESTCGQNSSLAVTIALETGERQLRLDIKIRWQEIGSAGTCVPQLNLLLRPAFDCAGFRYDIPLGLIERPALEHDVPASSFGMALNTAGRSLMLAADSKYGFRGNEDGLSLTLVRSSYDPDPWPEIGEHTIHAAVALCGDSGLADRQAARAFCQPLTCVTNSAHPGQLPRCTSLVRLSGGQVRLEAIKMSEDGQAMIVRLSSPADKSTMAKLDFWQKPRAACQADLNEQPLDTCDQPEIAGTQVVLSMPPYSVRTLRVNF